MQNKITGRRDFKAGLITPMIVRTDPMTSGRLRAQIGPAVGQPPAGQLESRVAAQPVEVVSILIAAGNGEDARAQDVGQEMSDPVLIAPVPELPGRAARRCRADAPPGRAA